MTDKERDVFDWRDKYGRPYPKDDGDIPFAVDGEPAEDAVLPSRAPKMLPREVAAAAVLLGVGATLAALVLRRR